MMKILMVTNCTTTTTTYNSLKELMLNNTENEYVF